ncbi:MAG: hydrolase [Halobacteriales archaeon SW_9_67_25]|nr:MAG: hydrolase [Halobacteriales archaeon SW_9_67_25]
MPYDAVVFDNDGVIVEPTDSTHITDAVCAALHDVGVDPDRERVEQAIAASAGPHETLQTVGVDAVDVERFWRRREDLAAATQMNLIRDGSKRLYDDVAALTQLDARLGMVSNNQHETVSFIVDHYGLDFFDVVYGREPTVAGAERKKPDPYYLERALSDLGTRDALYVGDSEVDVRAAGRAGVDSAFLRRDHSADTELSAEPTYEVTDLYDLAEVVREG